MARTTLKAINEMAKKLTRQRRAEELRRTSADGPVDPLAGEVNPFAAAHGDYERQNSRITNHGGTPIARWIASGMLTRSQQAAILHCITLWQAISSSGKLVANLDRTVFGCPGDGHPMEIEARSDLQRIKGHFPAKWWDVFENVVRFDEPAGVAGSKLTDNKEHQVAVARTTVQFVADVIAMKERLTY